MIFSLNDSSASHHPQIFTGLSVELRAITEIFESMRGKFIATADVYSIGNGRARKIFREWKIILRE